MGDDARGRGRGGAGVGQAARKLEAPSGPTAEPPRHGPRLAVNEAPTRARAPADGSPEPPGARGDDPGDADPEVPNPVELDQLIHGRVRLGIVSALAVHETLAFPELRDLLGTSDGNLSVHARRLEEGGYLRCTKSFEGRIPRTEYQLTPRGRAALGRYLDHMEALIEQVREG